MKGLLCALVLAVAGCYGSDAAGPIGDAPVRLSGVMKLAADSLVVSLRVTNTSDTTLVIAWHECLSAHPANFGVFVDANLNQQLWEQQRLPRQDCPNEQEQRALAPDQSHLILGWPIGVEQILGDSIGDGTYHIAIMPLTLTVRPAGGSYEMPVQGRVRVGTMAFVASD